MLRGSQAHLPQKGFHLITQLKASEALYTLSRVQSVHKRLLTPSFGSGLGAQGHRHRDESDKHSAPRELMGYFGRLGEKGEQGHR